MASFATSRDRAHGVLLAAAAGDALGWAQEARGGMVGGKRARHARRPQAEFEGWTRNAGTRFARYTDPVDPGAYSDDTQLMLAVARSCLTDQPVRHLIEYELPAWPLYQRGGGRAVLAASHAWASRRAPWIPGRRADSLDKVANYFRAGANGVAMRIAPHVLRGKYAGMPMGRTFQNIVVDGITTHGHPRALVGALTYAAALDFALSSTTTLETSDLVRAARDGLLHAEEVLSWLPSDWFDNDRQPADFAKAWNRTNEEMLQLLDIARHSLQQGSMSNATDTLTEMGAIGEYAGSGTITAAAAIYLASRSGTRPISGLLQAAFQHDADTDTLASMTGALLGAIHGHDWLGQLRDVQDASYMHYLADRLIEGTSRYPVGPARPPRELTQQLDDEELIQGIFSDSRHFEVASRVLLGEQPWVVRNHLQLDDGQTVIIDRITRKPTTHRTLEIPSTKEATIDTETPPHVDDTVDYQIAVNLPVADLDAIVAFYSLVVGANLPVGGDTVTLTRGLSFTQSATQPSLWSADARIKIAVDDLRAAANRLQATIIRGAGQPDHIIAADPDGRSVQIITE